PLIQYMFARYGLAGVRGNREQRALDNLSAFEGMLDSRYHPVFKFMAGYRCVDAARADDPHGNRSVAIELTTMELEDLGRDTNAPIQEVVEPAFLWVQHSQAKGWIDFVMSDFQGILEKNWSQKEPFYRLRGLVEIDRAWGDRGGGYADTVNTKGWEGFA